MISKIIKIFIKVIRISFRIAKVVLLVMIIAAFVFGMILGSSME